MRARRLLSAMVFSALISCPIFASDHSSVLNQVQELIKQKDYSAAKGLLANRLKVDRNSYKLWLALGYVYEADSDYIQALKAFMRASELQTGIDGLATRINRLQEMAKSQPQKVSKENSDDAGKARDLMVDARYKHSFKEYLEAYKLFVKAVELDRSILAHDYGFINNGLKYFSENANQPEHQFYLGAYNFYAGLYQKAEDMLNDYSREYPKGTCIEIARNMLQECKDIATQAAAAEAAVIAASKTEEANVQQKQKAASSATTDDQPYTVAIDEPQFGEIQQTYEVSPDGEPFEIAEARAKVNMLLQNFDRESDDEKKFQILWRIGVIRQPFPEVMSKFSSLLAKDSIETIYATLEALEKINLPGAEACAPQLYQLLGHKDVRVVFRAIQSFVKMPVQAEKVVPRLFNIYQNERHDIRKNLIIRAFKAYKTDALAILDAMIKDAPGPNKRPIAEVISKLTGESVEDIVRNS